MNRRMIIKALLAIPLGASAALAGNSRPKQLRGWIELASTQLNPAASSTEIVPQDGFRNISAVRLMPRASGIWIDSVDVVHSDGTVASQILKRRLLPGRFSEVLTFNQPARLLRVHYSALPFGDEAFSLSVWVERETAVLTADTPM